MADTRVAAVSAFQAGTALMADPWKRGLSRDVTEGGHRLGGFSRKPPPAGRGAGDEIPSLAPVAVPTSTPSCRHVHHSGIARLDIDALRSPELGTQRPLALTAATGVTLPRQLSAAANAMTGTGDKSALPARQLYRVARRGADFREPSIEAFMPRRIHAAPR